MLTLITAALEIERLQASLEQALTRNGEAFEADYKTRGSNGTWLMTAYYFKKWDIYWKTGDSTNVNRYWNSFGRGKPRELKDAFQINIPKVGIDRKIQGGFLSSELGTFLLHRGTLKGGGEPMVFIPSVSLRRSR